MRLAVEHGFPVPALHSVDGSDMVLDRVVGLDLVAAIGKRPWKVASYGRLLGDLHLRLREIPIGDLSLRAVEPNEALVHGDLHPGNVMLSDDGPVVIDWESARTGPADFDAATTWLLMSVAEVDDVPSYIRPIVGLVRRRMAAAFLRRVGRPSPRSVAVVCDLRLLDVNMRPTERARITEFRAEHGEPPGGDAPIAP